MLQYVKASKITTLAAMAALFALSFLIFGCGDDETPAPTAAPAPAAIDVSAITAGVSAGLTAQMEQTIRDEMAKAQPPLSEDEIRTLIEDAVSKSARKASPARRCRQWWIAPWLQRPPRE